VNERKSPGRGPGSAGGPGGGAPKGGARGQAGKPPARPAAAAKPAAPKPVAPAAKPAPKPPAPKPAAPVVVAPKVDAGGRKLSFKRTLIGRVKSDKMNKTIVVEVIRSKLDPVYKKYVRVRKTYQAHDEENAAKIGDRVEIIEHRPLSKMKRWKLLNLVERAVQE
jgi:small subunit ribosomal protein S17